MRGGAIPIIAWALLLTVLTVGNAIWQGRWLPASQFALAAVIIFAFGAFVVALSGRLALRKGAPEISRRPEAVPEVSAGAVAAALSLALLVFGFVFGSVLIYMGAGFLVVSFGRLALEVYSQRKTVEHSDAEHPS